VQEIILWLDRRLPRRLTTLIGPKAASLCRLRRFGMKVPPGFFVTTEAFREHLETCDLRSRIAVLTDVLHTRPEGLQPVLEQIRQLIVTLPLTECLRGQIEAAYHRLGADAVAVRSSATAEDLPGHSFAGQYETILDVRSLEVCLDAIKKCWASLWTERAYEYRRRNGIDHGQVEMAVIVQKLVPARASGVLFTADPVSARTDRVIIDACLGLGDALVSGRAAADHFIVSKRGLSIVTQEAGAAGQAPALDRATVRELVKLARRVERRLGSPQDIEWAVADSKIYLLQSRPITALDPTRARRDRYIWSSFPAREVVPDVVTPMTRSIIDEFAGSMFDPFLRTIGVDRMGVPLHGYLAGHVYFNASFWAAVIKRLPGSRRYDFAADVGSNPSLVRMIEMLDQATTDDLPPIKASPIRFMRRVPVLILGYLLCTPGKGQRVLARIRVENERCERLDVCSMSIDELVRAAGEIVAVFRNVLGSFSYMLGVMAAYPALQVVCARWFHDRALAGRLLAGVGNMDDVQAALDLWTLAVKANERPHVKEAILAEGSWDDIEASLSRLSQAAAFLGGWREFMTRHGHHCRAEIELHNPRWPESPDYVLGLIRGYLSCLDIAGPLENRRRIARERCELQEHCRRRLRNPIKRMFFRHLVARSQNGAVFRENIKSEIVRLLAAARRLLVELGNRLSAAGVFADPDDIFFLKLEEVDPVVHGRVEFDVRAVVAARRAEHDRWNSITPPDLIVGEFDPQTYVPEDIDVNVETLRGLAVSPGVATGKARVVLRADSHTRLEAGEILVAPFTDPGWTPYFMPAAGIVMNQGSLLSHGSIIARELGIPAVTNVGHATEIIRTGQTILVDGDRGIVRIIQ